MKVLITGYSGKIAQAVGNALSHAGWRVLGQSASLPAGPNLWQGPFDQLPAEMLAGCQALVHLAGATPRHTRQETAYESANISANRRLASLVESHCPSMHLVYFSTTSVYGAAPGPIWHEETPPQPTDAYGRSKLGAEQIFLGLKSPGRPVAVLRCPAVLGGGAAPTWLSAAIEKLQKNEEIQLSNPDAPYNRLVTPEYLGSLVAALLAKRGEGIFNAAPSEPLPLREIFRLLKQKTGSTSAVTYGASHSDVPILSTTRLAAATEGGLLSTKTLVERLF